MAGSCDRHVSFLDKLPKFSKAIERFTFSGAMREFQFLYIFTNVWYGTVILFLYRYVRYFLLLCFGFR